MYWLWLLSRQSIIFYLLHNKLATGHSNTLLLYCSCWFCRSCLWFDFGVLTSLSAIFQLYHGDQYHWAIPIYVIVHGLSDNNPICSVFIDCLLFEIQLSRVKTWDPIYRGINAIVLCLSMIRQLSWSCPGFNNLMW